VLRALREAPVQKSEIRSGSAAATSARKRARA
jgi:hypothetical protein